MNPNAQSPLTLTTGASGRASLAPMANGTPTPMQPLVPELRRLAGGFDGSTCRPVASVICPSTLYIVSRGKTCRTSFRSRYVRMGFASASKNGWMDSPFDAAFSRSAVSHGPSSALSRTPSARPSISARI